MERNGPSAPLPPIDSLVCQGGPLPPASLGVRALAFFMDAFLIGLLGMLIVLRFAWPSEFPEAQELLMRWVEAEGENAAPDPYLIEALGYAQSLLIALFTLYFGLGELFFNGGSLGKRALRLRTISLITLEKPRPLPALLRSFLKALSLLFLPVLAVVLILPLFNRRRHLLGHDLLCRTIVIDERNIPNIPPPPG
jgi:uncharacterized RDD family membrane protein YckC